MTTSFNPVHSTDYMEMCFHNNDVILCAYQGVELNPLLRLQFLRFNIRTL